jgi:transcriptional regulator with XRE-family HTH domain
MAKKQIGSIAARLRHAIQASGLSLSHLGRQVGVDHSRLSRFLRGERDLTLDAVDRLCQVLGLAFAEPDGVSNVNADAPKKGPGRPPKQPPAEAAAREPAPAKKGRRKKGE